MNQKPATDKIYHWPDLEMANASGDNTRPSKLIAATLRVLGEIIHDFAKNSEQRQAKHYGFYQLCPKCDGEKEVPNTDIDANGAYRLTKVCPLCDGDGKLVRPEIKKDS